MGPPESRDNGNSKLLTALLIVVAFVAIVGGAKPPAAPYNPDGRRIWSIAIGHDWGAHEYFDSKGYIQGFSKDLMNAVCKAGNMDCYAIWMPYIDCWNNAPAEHGRAGRGLMDSWIDACMGWIPTTDRIHTVSFGLSYIKPVRSNFYKKKGSNVDANDLAGKKVGFITGWWSDEKCLARHESSSNRNYVVSKDQVFLAPTAEDLVQLLVDNKIDLAFSSLDTKEKYFEHIEELNSPVLDCAIGGSAQMTRKDSGFLTEWNRAFQKLKSSGQFAKLCQEAQQRHELHGQLWCVD